MDQAVGADVRAPRIAFIGLGGDFFLLQLGNLALTILTLGVYRFWGKTRCRRFLWRNTEIDGDPLEYRGAGVELLIGAILAILLISIPLGLMSLVLPAMLGVGSAALVLSQFVVLLAIYYIVGVGLYRSWRYILSRTAWRGIRAGMTAQGWAFGVYQFALLMAQMFSLGFATPWVGVRRWNRLVRDMRVGSLALHADARAGPVYGRFLIVWVAMLLLFAGFAGIVGASIWGMQLEPNMPPSPGQILVLIGSIYGGLFVVGFLGALVFAQYHAAFLRETYGHTYVGETMRLRFDAGAKDVLIYYLINFALVVFTLGLGMLLLPYRRWEFHFRRIAVEGALDEDELRQTTLAAPGQGDGIADAFDLAPF